MSAWLDSLSRPKYLLVLFGVVAASSLVGFGLCLAFVDA